MNKYEPNAEEISAIIQEGKNDKIEDIEIVESLKETFGISTATGYRWLRTSTNESELPEAFQTRQKIDSFKLEAIEHATKAVERIRNKDDPMALLEALDKVASIACKLKKAWEILMRITTFFLIMKLKNAYLPFIKVRNEIADTLTKELSIDFEEAVSIIDKIIERESFLWMQAEKEEGEKNV